jgi:hypothetical protein
MVGPILCKTAVDLPSFNRAFRQHFGRTPSEVRRGD